MRKLLAFLLFSILLIDCTKDDAEPPLADAPRSGEATVLTSKSVKLTWKNPEARWPNQYIIQRIIKGTTFAPGTSWGSASLNIGSPISYSCKDSCNLVAFSYTDSSLQANTTYSYRIYSVGYYQGSDSDGKLGGFIELEATTPVEYVNLSNISLGNQIWAGKNLDVTTYSNGDPIPQVKSLTQWNETRTGAWCYFNFDSTYGPLYGKIYNRFAVDDSRGLAPNGWRIPTSSDWYTLRDFLGGKQVAGDKLKSTTLWVSGGGKPSNSSQFNAFPSGLVSPDPKRTIVNGKNAYFWTSTDTIWSGTIKGRMSFWLDYDMPELYNSTDTSHMGYAVRCIKK